MNDFEASMYKVVRLTDDEEQAWKLYCLETKGAMSAADFWHELPRHIQKNYLDKIVKPETESLKYDFICEAMLQSIKKQREDKEERYILDEFSPDQLKVIERFIVSFAYREEEGLREFAKKHEDFLDNYWKEKVEKAFK